MPVKDTSKNLIWTLLCIISKLQLDEKKARVKNRLAKFCSPTSRNINNCKYIKGNFNNELAFSLSFVTESINHFIPLEVLEGDDLFFSIIDGEEPLLELFVQFPNFIEYSYQHHLLSSLLLFHLSKKNIVIHDSHSFQDVLLIS